MSKLNLIGLSLAELKDAFAPLGLEPFRAKQVWAWLYVHGARTFEQMTTLAKPAREKLDAAFSLARPEIVVEQKSVDGTRKWLLRFEDGQEVECVYIPEEDRGALCVSSQVGCPMGCAFCRTGTQKLTRNLTAGEIVAQVMIARDVLGEWPSTKEPRMLSNIVMMGMGEPLHNYENVAKAIKIMMDEGGIAIGRRRITLSTCGIVPLIERCGAELGVNLAISLHATTDEVRDRLMPVNRKYPIAQLMQACRDYPAAKNARRITFEYVMLKGINDSLDDARRLVKLVAGLPAKINLLPYNGWEGSPFETSAPETLQAFAELINKAGYASPVRTPRGRDILAACGQLKSASEREKGGRHSASGIRHPGDVSRTGGEEA